MILNILGVAFLLSHYRSLSSELALVFIDPKAIRFIPFKIMRCMMCSSFWVALIYTGGNVPFSGFISLLGFLVDKYLLSTNIKL